MPTNDTDALILRHLAGESSATEEATLQQWRTASAENEQHFQALKATWQGTEAFEPPTIPDARMAEARLRAQLAQPKRSSSWRWLSAAAAVAVLLVGASWWMLQDTPTFITHTSGAAEKTIELADGSVITLNANSSITVPEHFQQQREVELTGEAFFKVARDTLHPFTVRAQGSQTTVLGTSFNINARSANVELAVVSGKVAFGTPNNPRALICVKEQSARLNGSQVAMLETADANQLSWMSDTLRCSQTPISEVVLALEQHYHTRITLANPDIGKCLFSGILAHATLEEALEVITLTLGTEHRIHNKTITIDGAGC